MSQRLAHDAAWPAALLLAERLALSGEERGLAYEVIRAAIEAYHEELERQRQRQKPSPN